MNVSKKITAALAVSGTLLLTSCTGGKTEDVRIKLCKEVTERILVSLKPVVFSGSHTSFRKIGDAAVILDFTINKKGYENRTVHSSCFFEHNTPEENVIDHVDRLAAFSTLPYAMTINGKAVPKEVLMKAVSAEQLEPVIEFVEQMKREIERSTSGQ